MDTYRECVRHVWNAYFASDARADTDWDSVDDFHAAAVSLFRALVLRKLGRGEQVGNPLKETWSEPSPFLRIELDPCGEILINRERSSGYWDHPLRSIQKGELDLAFLGYFDWSTADHRDFAYYRVRIVDSAKHLDVVGKDALVPIAPNVRVVSESDSTTLSMGAK